jgi:hypothetical protein
MSLTDATLARMGEESRFPTDETSALVFKMLLQHCAEMDHMDTVVERHAAGIEMVFEDEISKITEAQRQIHLEFVKRFPQYKYASQLSYAYNHDQDQPELNGVDAQGNSCEFAEKYDFARDATVHAAFEQIFKNHTKVFEDGTYEFCWEEANNNLTVTYRALPDEGQSLH